MLPLVFQSRDTTARVGRDTSFYFNSRQQVLSLDISLSFLQPPYSRTAKGKYAVVADTLDNRTRGCGGWKSPKHSFIRRCCCCNKLQNVLPLALDLALNNIHTHKPIPLCPFLFPHSRYFALALWSHRAHPLAFAFSLSLSTAFSLSLLAFPSFSISISFYLSLRRLLSVPLELANTFSPSPFKPLHSRMLLRVIPLEGKPSWRSTHSYSTCGINNKALTPPYSYHRFSRLLDYHQENSPWV